MNDTTTRSINFLTGVSNDRVKAVAFEEGIGLLIQPGNSYDLQIDEFPAWAADNGAFSTVNVFDIDAWAAWITELAGTITDDQRARCLFVTAPDVLTVLADGTVIGEAAPTIERFRTWGPAIRALGLPAALVAQDGAEEMGDSIPWEHVDVVFLGGSTEWKVGEGGRRMAELARAHGKRVHMGRVNSARRFRIASEFGCDTADGTFLAFAGADKGTPRLLKWWNGGRGVGAPMGAPAGWARNVLVPAVEETAAAEVDAPSAGVGCGRCSYWAEGRRVTVRHENNAAVRACHGALTAAQV